MTQQETNGLLEEFDRTYGPREEEGAVEAVSPLPQPIIAEERELRAGEEREPLERLMVRFANPDERKELTGEELHRVMIEGRANPGLLDDELLWRWSQYQWRQGGKVGVEFRAGYDFDYGLFRHQQEELRNRQRAEMEAGKGGVEARELDELRARWDKGGRQRSSLSIAEISWLAQKRRLDFTEIDAASFRRLVGYWYDNGLQDAENYADFPSYLNYQQDNWDKHGWGSWNQGRRERTGLREKVKRVWEKRPRIGALPRLEREKWGGRGKKARREMGEIGKKAGEKLKEVEKKELALYLAKRTPWVNLGLTLGLWGYSAYMARQTGQPVGSIREGMMNRARSFKKEFAQMWTKDKEALAVGLLMGGTALGFSELVGHLVPVPIINGLIRQGVRDLSFLILAMVGAGVTRLGEKFMSRYGSEGAQEDMERLTGWVDEVLLAAAWARTGLGLAWAGFGAAQLAGEHFDLPSVTFGQAPATAGGRIGEIGRAEGPIRPIGEIGGGRAAQEGMRMGEATTRVAATATSIATVMPTATATETVIPTATRVPTETPEATPTAAPEVQSYSTPEVEGGPELPEELRGKAVFTGKVNDVSDGWRAYGVDDIGKEGGPPEHMIFVNNGQELVYDRTDLTYGQLHPEAEVAAGVKDDHIYRQGNEFVRIDDNGRTHFVGLDSDNDSKLDEIMAVDKDGTFIDHPDKNIGIVWQKVNPDAGYRVDQGHFYQYDLKGNEELVGIRVEGEPAWMVAADKLPAEITSQFGRDLYLGPDGLYEPGFIRVALVTEGTTLENLTDTRIRAVWEMSVKNVHSLTWFREREIEGDGKQWFVDQNGQRIAFENVNAPADFRPIVYAEYEGVRPGYDLNRDGVIEPTEGEWKEGVWHVKLPDGTEYVDKNGDGILEKAGEKVAETTPEPLPQAEEEGVRPIRPIGRIGPIGERGEEAGSAEEPAGAAVPAEQPPTEAEPVAEAVKVEKPEEWVSEKFGRLRIGATGGFQGKVMEEMLGGDRGWVTAETYTPNQLAGAADYVWKEVAKIKGLTEAPIVRDGQTPAGLAEMEQKDLEDLYRKALAWAKKEM